MAVGTSGSMIFWGRRSPKPCAGRLHSIDGQEDPGRASSVGGLQLGALPCTWHGPMEALMQFPVSAAIIQWKRHKLIYRDRMIYAGLFSCLGFGFGALCCCNFLAPTVFEYGPEPFSKS